MSGIVIHLAVSKKRGVAKTPVERIQLIPEWGVTGDAHGGNWDRQVSILSVQHLQGIADKGIEVDINQLAANVLVKGLDLSTARSGDGLCLGETVLRVSQIGKFYPHGSPWHKEVLSRYGIFARVIKGGEVRIGDGVTLITQE